MTPTLSDDVAVRVVDVPEIVAPVVGVVRVMVGAVVSGAAPISAFIVVEYVVPAPVTVLVL